jgi:hypothetical protein
MSADATEIQHLGDVGVSTKRSDLRFTSEASLGLGATSQTLRDAFDGNVFLKVVFAPKTRKKDVCHPSGANAREEFISPKSGGEQVLD